MFSQVSRPSLTENKSSYGLALDLIKAYIENLMDGNPEVLTPYYKLLENNVCSVLVHLNNKVCKFFKHIFFSSFSSIRQNNLQIFQCLTTNLKAAN